MTKADIRLKLSTQLYNRITEIASARSKTRTQIAEMILEAFLFDAELVKKYMYVDLVLHKHTEASAKGQHIHTPKDELIVHKVVTSNVTIHTAQRLDKNVKAFIEYYANARPTMQFDIIGSSECRITSMGKTVTVNVKDQALFEKKLMSLPEDLGEGFVYEYSMNEHTLTLPADTGEYMTCASRQECVDRVESYKSMIALGIDRATALKNL